MRRRWMNARRSLAALTAFATLGLSLGAAAHAAARPQLCASARAEMAKSADIAAAMTAAFGRLPMRAAGDAVSPCIHPVKYIHFAAAELLLTIAQDPDTACHGCGAMLSGYFFRRENGALKLINRTPNFVEIGSNGLPGAITPIGFAGDDAIVVEGGGTFQGYTSTSAALVVFRAGRAVNLTPKDFIPLSADDSDAKVDGGAVSVDAKWSVASPTSADFVVDYVVEAQGHKGAARAVWSERGDKLTVTSGAVPKEWAEASGQ